MGSWIRGKIKFMFWSLVASSVMMVMMSFSPQHQKKAFEFFRSVKAKLPSGQKALQDASHGAPLASEVQKQVSASSDERVINNESYVLIQGKYYKARADNTYMVNGEKVFVVNNRQAASAPTVDPKTVAASAQSSGEATHAELPTTPGEMFEAFKKINNNMKQRDQYLEEVNKGQ